MIADSLDKDAEMMRMKGSAQKAANSVTVTYETPRSA
jgi:hypothetical protein